ncbi:MAG: hypothetical protein JJE36_05965 [Coriobacteriia bacterium]|nr:hypothetical protein [Coriobacteriia bacterium]
MPHGDVTFGAGYYAIIGIYILVAVAALVLIFDARRERRIVVPVSFRAAGHKREPLIVYQIIAGIYVLVFIAAQFSFVPGPVKGAAIISIPLMIITELAYLLRVVFPKVPDGMVKAQDEEFEYDDRD